MDCSLLLGRSLNDGINKDSYLGEQVRLIYPTVDDLVSHILQLMMSVTSQNMFLYKEDMDHAFR